MAKYNNAYAVLLNNGESQILPISKAQLIELAYSQSQGQFGTGSKDVAAALTYLLNKSNTDLDTAKTYTGEQINDLNGEAKANTGYVLSYIVEEGGVIRTEGTQTWLDASVVSYQGGDGENAPTTVQEVIEDIQTTLNSLAGDGEGSVQTQITNALDALDLPQVSEAGKPITYVSQENGRVAAGTGNIDAQYVDVDNSGNKFNIAGENAPETLSTQATLEQLQNEITALDESAAVYTIVADGASGTNANVYHLQQTINNNTTHVGSAIEIPKDRTLTYVWLGNGDDTIDSTTGNITNGSGDGQSMNFVHYLADGSYALTKVDVSYFLAESEFDTTKGLTVDNHVVGVNVKSGDNYIEIDGNGAIASKGIDTAISTAVENFETSLSSSVGEVYTASDVAYVITKVDQADGKLSAYNTVELTDARVKTTMAYGDSLYALAGGTETTAPTGDNDISNIKNALNVLANNIKAAQGDGVTGVVGDTDNTYVNITATKAGNTVTLTVDESYLGNVAHLQYDELSTLDSNEMITILNANA